MANKQTIDDINAALDVWHRKLSMVVRKIDELRAKRKKILMGKLKQPEPPGVKVMFKNRHGCPQCGAGPNSHGSYCPNLWHDKVDDLYAVAPGSTGAC